MAIPSREVMYRTLDDWSKGERLKYKSTTLPLPPVNLFVTIFLIPTVYVNDYYSRYRGRIIELINECFDKPELIYPLDSNRRILSFQWNKILLPQPEVISRLEFIKLMCKSEEDEPIPEHPEAMS